MPETHILSLRDNGREIVAAVGDTLVVSLPETPSTGFRWVVEAQGGLRPAGDRFDPGEARRARRGCAASPGRLRPRALASSGSRCAGPGTRPEATPTASGSA